MHNSSVNKVSRIFSDVLIVKRLVSHFSLSKLQLLMKVLSTGTFSGYLTQPPEPMIFRKE